MTKQTAIELAGGVTALARLLGIKPASVSQWKENVPQLRVYQLKELKPGWFA
jgi:DNA-binding transcriptional regulator YdaS (Cro superfamily)